MRTLPNLELDFEILTLTHNIDKLKKLGYRTADLQRRLDYCHAQVHSLELAESDVLDNGICDMGVGQ